jgi:YVTN family beta-propeller protein
VYCADSGAGNVVVIDCSTNMVVTAVAAGESPCLISYVQGSNRAYTLSDRDEMLTVIHCAVNQPFWNGSVEAGPYSTAWNPRYSRLFIAEYGSGLVEIRRDAATDVAVVSITDPHGRYVLGDTVVPIATCRNYGNAPATFMAFMRLYFSSPTPVYVESVSVTGLLPGRDTLVVFGRACTLMQLGWWTARCTTRYSGDLVKANDWQSQSFSVSGPDVGVSQIIAPAGEVDTNSFVTPRATWRAFAGSPTSFKAFAKLFDPARVLVYLDSQAVAGLPVNGETTLVFSRFNVEERYGTWTVRCSTFMPNDSGRANNVLARQFVVKAGGISLVPGWGELEDLPLSPSGKPVKEGGWLAYMDGDECVYAAKGNKTGDFFRYDPLADTWHLLAPIPKGNEGKLPGKGANATTDADRFLYATKGNNTLGFWRYDIERNSWRQLADVKMSRF